jgi:putative oxygen-independent coproporphyrinogen III oxidase
MALPLSLYVHIPFCRKRCSYCAFNTYTGLDHLIDPLVRALISEMRIVRACLSEPASSSHTLYFGGGTPSLLAVSQVEDVIGAARTEFDLTPAAEITLEANPATSSLENLVGYRSAGVNRLSIGVQSAHAVELELFKRDHTFEEAYDTFKIARQAGCDNINVDLIYGAPGQTRRNWRESVEAVLSWKPEHISLYALSLEPGTALTWQVDQGQLPHPDPDLAADMYEDARRLLAGTGFVHYEISNWARPGFESVHNRQYWLNQPFLGFGPGAHGMVNGVRYWNARPVSEYIERINTGIADAESLSPACDGCEPVTEEHARADTVILGLRLLHEGLERERFSQRHQIGLDDAFGQLLLHLENQGLLLDDGDRIRLAEHTYLVSNQIFSQFMPEGA